MKNMMAGLILFLVVVGGANSLFVVKETERAILLRFGTVERADLEPGLHFKMPWVNTVRKFDARVLTVTADAQRYLTLEQKALVVDSFAKWRIFNTAQFYTATSGDEVVANNLLAQRITTGLRNEFGERTKHAYRMGDAVSVTLQEAAPVTGGLRFGLAGVEAPPDRRNFRPGGPKRGGKPGKKSRFKAKKR